MAEAVTRALAERRYLLVEAGTGTGKTLAYLVPALRSGRKVVVSTATKTLQDQIFFKDLPLLAERAGLSFRAAYMKGRSNYLCLARFGRFEQEPLFQTKHDARLYPRLRAWAKATETGDKSELDLPEGFAAWRELSATADTCTGQRCPDYEACFVTKMRAEAAAADLVVVNHALFFADVAVRTGKSKEVIEDDDAADPSDEKRRPMRGAGEVIPRYDVVIFDEAHALEEIASEHFGTHISSFKLEELARDGERMLLPGHEKYPEAAPAWAALRTASQALFGAVSAQLPQSESVRLTPALREAAMAQSSDTFRVLESVRESLAGDELAEVASLGRRAGELAEQLRFVLAEEKPSHVYFAEQRMRSVALRAAPVDVAEELARRVYPALDTAVFTSATLSTGGSFEFLKKRLGLVDSKGQPRVELESKSLPSPFDYGSQSILYVPVHLPEPNDPRFTAAAAAEVEALTHVTDGRAFVLCTSLRQMGELYKLLEGRLPWQMLLQGELPKQKLLERFREEPSVLFASQSFWEGVDVPGDALSLVIIDRLPFANPKDPVVAARIQWLKEQGQEPFDAYQVPEAALSLRQGFGRLIRTQRDRGIVAVLDKRVRTKGYGRKFLESLPPATRVGDFAKLGPAWKKIRDSVPGS
ncbi:MAG: ATP-dependent DNA helicase [Deltaproteobacteria bacterium]|nr:ATP-dependent DNA helicase [Deltaproteobacteria bacterium]